MSQHFDEHIKKRFGEYSPEVDPLIWERIVDKRKKRKPGTLLFLLLHNRNRLLVLFLLLAGGSGAWLYTNHSYNKDHSTASNNTIKHNNNSSSQDKNNDPSQDIAAISNDKPTAESNTAVADNNETYTDAAGIPPGTTIHRTGNSDQTSSVVPFRNTPDTRLNRGHSTKTRVQRPGITDNNSEAMEETDETEEGLPAGGTLLGRLSYTAEKVALKRNLKSGIPIEASPLSFLPGCPSLEKNAAGNKKYFELYAAADYGLRSFKDTGNSTYMQKRKESTRFASGFSAGLRFTRVFNNSMSIRGGVNFSQINERFSFSQGNIVQITYIINAQGDTTGSYTTVGTRMKTTQNRYRTIDIPLVIGYELGNGRFHANINAGAIVNLYSWQKGEILNDSLQPVSITTGKGNSPYQYKTNAGLGITGGVSLYYKLNDKWHIMAEPYFRYNLSPMNKENITLKQKYNTIGLRLGIRMDIP